MPYENVDKLMDALRGVVKKRQAAITKMMVDVVSQELEDGSLGKLPPPEVFSVGGSRALLAYTNEDDIKTFKKEEAVGSRPYSKMMNRFRAGTLALLRKRGYI